MNVDYQGPPSSVIGIKRKATPFSRKNNADNKIARVKLEPNQISNDSVIKTENIAQSNLLPRAIIIATSTESPGEKKKVELYGGYHTVVSQIKDRALLNGHGCWQFDNDHIHFTLNNGCACKFEGEIVIKSTEDTYTGQLTRAPWALLPQGQGRVRYKNGLVIEGSFKVYSNEEGVCQWKVVNGESFYLGEVPPKEIVVVHKKIENGKPLETIAYLPTGEVIVGIQPFTENTLIGKKENSPDYDGKIIGDKLVGRWIKFVPYNDVDYYAIDARFENDEYFDEIVSLPAGISATDILAKTLPKTSNLSSDSRRFFVGSWQIKKI